jgi:formylglycine-generating enzyme required for sulfatase activity
MTEKIQPIPITEILPPPFAWIQIPGGDVTLEHIGGYLGQPVTVFVTDFTLAKYPITNAQYQTFVDAPDGYVNESWWDYSEPAVDWRGDNSQPSTIQFGGDDHPRTHVTWYEAVAFCNWLSEKTGDDIRLPSETEWQRAAHGNDNRQFPWGDEWDAARCKNNVAHDSIGVASVLDYAGKGDSPYRVVDMTGNVWEWCATSWETGKNDLTADHIRVLRGGSWFDDVIRNFRVTNRASWNPDITSDLRGFRIARS